MIFYYVELAYLLLLSVSCLEQQDLYYYLLLLVGIPIHATVAINKFATGISSFSTILVLVLKRKVKLKEMLPLMLFAGLGGIFGAFFHNKIIGTNDEYNCLHCVNCYVFCCFKKQKKLG